MKKTAKTLINAPCPDTGPSRNRQILLVVIMATMLGGVLVSLSGCMLERFRHEKYTCQNSNLNIAEIVIRSAKKGKEVKIFGYDGDRVGTIEKISSHPRYAEVFPLPVVELFVWGHAELASVQ